MNSSAILMLAIVLSGSAGAAVAQGGPTKSLPSSNTPPAMTVPISPASPAAPATTQDNPSTAPNPPSISATPPTARTPSTGLPANGVILTEADAYSRLEQQGFRKIDGLRKDADGMWRATAIRGAVAVNVMVDIQGKVVAQ